MDKTVERVIKQLEKQAAKAERLKERAATLLKEAAEIETTRKPLFEALILKSAYAAGLDRWPLGTIVAGFEALREASVTKPTIVSPTSEPRVHHLADDATIQLVVKIGRNTAPSRFAVLDQYLAWNGKEGHWSGIVSPAVLMIFKATFEPERMIVSSTVDEWTGEEPSNTSTDAFDNLATTVQHLNPPPTMPGLATEIDQGNLSQIDDWPATVINPVEIAVPVTAGAATAGEAVQDGSHIIPPLAGDPATTKEMSTTGVETGATAPPQLACRGPGANDPAAP